MKREALISVVAVCLLSGPLFGFSGTLTVADNQLDGTGFWVSDNGQEDWFPASISWNVTENLDSTWHYSYTLTVFRADVSHFILETSLGFGSVNLLNAQVPGQVAEITTHNPGPGNPYMPDSVYGVKFEIGDPAVAEPDYTTVTVSFDSDRVPVWGDFYAKCGAVGGTQNTLWNAGFLLDDPMDAASDGTVLNHILVPDTIPEPATMALLGLGGLVLMKRRK